MIFVNLCIFKMVTILRTGCKGKLWGLLPGLAFEPSTDRLDDLDCLMDCRRERFRQRWWHSTLPSLNCNSSKTRSLTSTNTFWAWCPGGRARINASTKWQNRLTTIKKVSFPTGIPRTSLSSCSFPSCIVYYSSLIQTHFNSKPTSSIPPQIFLMASFEYNKYSSSSLQ